MTTLKNTKLSIHVARMLGRLGKGMSDQDIVKEIEELETVVEQSTPKEIASCICQVLYFHFKSKN